MAFRFKKNEWKNITRQNYVRYRIAICDDEFNPFLRVRRLTQQYMVHSQVKIERDRIH